MNSFKDLILSKYFIMLYPFVYIYIYMCVRRKRERGGEIERNSMCEKVRACELGCTRTGEWGGIRIIEI